MLVEDVEVAESELQVWLRLDELARLFVLEIERAGDRITETSETPRSRRSALLLQANAASSMLAASAHPEAKLAYFDAWVLVEQFRQYFGGSAAKTEFGQQAARLEEATARVSSSFEVAARSVIGEVEADRARQQVALWAARHALESETFLRRSAIGTLAEELEGRADGALVMTRRLGRAAEALESRLGLYAEVLPRVFRWQAQLAVEAPELRELVDRSVGTLDAVEQLLVARSEEEKRILDQIEALVERQRGATLAEAHLLAEAVAKDSVDRAVELVWRKVLLLAAVGFIAACFLIWLQSRLVRRE